MTAQVRVTISNPDILDDLAERIGISDRSKLVNYILIDYRANYGQKTSQQSVQQGTIPRFQTPNPIEGLL